jgi:hypothetical protein
MTFYFANIFVGDAPNDGSGDPLRTAFSKINQNFNSLTSNIGNAEIRCLGLTSTYISSFNLVQAGTVGNVGTVFTGESLTVNTVTANSIVGTITSGSFVNLTVSDKATISSATITSGNIPSLTAASANISTANIPALSTTSLTASGGSINGTVIGNTQTASGSFTSVSLDSGGNIDLSIGNITSVNYLVRHIVSHLDLDINGNANAFSFVLNTTGSSGQYVVYNIASNTNVTSNTSGTITTGIERFYMIRNQGVGTANLILPMPGGNTNKGTNVVPIAGGTSAAIRFVAFGPNIQSVFAEISNN